MSCLCDAYVVPGRHPSIYVHPSPFLCLDNCGCAFSYARVSIIGSAPLHGWRVKKLRLSMLKIEKFSAKNFGLWSFISKSFQVRLVGYPEYIRSWKWFPVEALPRLCLLKRRLKARASNPGFGGYLDRYTVRNNFSKRGLHLSMTVEPIPVALLQ